MTQEQYLLIVKCINHGAAACADELIIALNTVITKCKSYEKKEKQSAQTQETKKKS